MGEAIIIRRGGISSGGNLDLTIVGGTTQPIIAKENTIWVNTDVAINGYAFSATKPESPLEGLLWFEIDAEKSYLSIDIDATEENAVRLYPISCRQYVNGVWENRSFETYLNGVWERGFWTYLYNKGDIYRELTGGWKSIGVGSNAYFNTPVAPTITYNATSMNIYQGDSSKYQAGTAHIINKIDLTPYSKATIIVNAVSTTIEGAAINFCIHDSFGKYQSDGLIAQTSCKTIGTKTIDVSNINRAVYLGIWAYWGVSMTFSEIRLEV